MGSARISKLPDSSVTAFCSRPVSRFLTATVAPGRAALEASVTAPRIDPCVPTWAMTGVSASSTSAALTTRCLRVDMASPECPVRYWWCTSIVRPAWPSINALRAANALTVPPIGCDVEPELQFRRSDAMWGRNFSSGCSTQPVRCSSHSALQYALVSSGRRWHSGPRRAPGRERIQSPGRNRSMCAR